MIFALTDFSNHGERFPVVEVEVVVVVTTTTTTCAQYFTEHIT